MIKKYLLLLVVVFSPILFAYRVGDKVGSEFYKKNSFLKDDIIIVDFFASWCKSCEKELPLVNKFFLENKNKNVKVIGIDTDEDIKEGIAFQKKLNLNFPIINDEKYEVVNKFSPIGMPALYYVKNYEIKKVIFGAIDDIDKIIIEDIKALENEK